MKNRQPKYIEQMWKTCQNRVEDFKKKNLKVKILQLFYLLIIYLLNDRNPQTTVYIFYFLVVYFYNKDIVPNNQSSFRRKPTVFGVTCFVVAFYFLT